MQGRHADLQANLLRVIGRLHSLNRKQRRRSTCRKQPYLTVIVEQKVFGAFRVLKSDLHPMRLRAEDVSDALGAAADRMRLR